MLRCREGWTRLYETGVVCPSQLWSRSCSNTLTFDWWWYSYMLPFKRDSLVNKGSPVLLCMNCFQSSVSSTLHYEPGGDYIRCRFLVSISMWEKLTTCTRIEFLCPLHGKSNHGPGTPIEELNLWCDSLSYRPEKLYKVWFWKVKEFIVSWKKWKTRSCLKSITQHSQEKRG